jgi:Zn-finger nucleic acid-binding protein
MLPVECPRCGTAMQEETFDGHLGRSVAIDICHACQSFWFDSRESVALTPGSTLALFRLIGEKMTRPARAPTPTSRSVHAARVGCGARRTCSVRHDSRT